MTMIYMQHTAGLLAANGVDIDMLLVQGQLKETESGIRYLVIYSKEEVLV